WFSRAVFPSSQRRARSASPVGRSLKSSCAIRKCREATEAAQTGWREARARQGEASIEGRHSRVFAELTTPSVPIKVASRNLIGVAATFEASPYRARASCPPLRGGESGRNICCALLCAALFGVPDVPAQDAVSINLKQAVEMSLRNSREV